MYIQPLPSQISSFKGNVKLKILKQTLADIHPVDLADILEELDHDQRVMVFSTWRMNMHPTRSKRSNPMYSGTSYRR
ncbi:MAG: hypothetical protein WC620_06130 [Methanoregula sp.]